MSDDTRPQDPARHWDARYAGAAEEGLSWTEAEPALSLRLVRAHLRPGEPVIDVGAGLSRLAERLLAAGCGPVSVLDLSEAALGRLRTRIGPGAPLRLIAADVTRWEPDGLWALWHDRAVFHFLTDPADRAAYVAAMDRALRPGGTAILITFDENGPETCSGLPVRRWSSRALAAEIDRLLPSRFRLLAAEQHAHTTPAGRVQTFQASVFGKAPP